MEEERNVEIFKALLENGADVKAEYREGRSFFDQICIIGARGYKYAKLLFKHGAEYSEEIKSG